MMQPMIKSRTLYINTITGMAVLMLLSLVVAGNNGDGRNLSSVEALRSQANNHSPSRDASTLEPGGPLRSPSTSSQQNTGREAGIQK